MNRQFKKILVGLITVVLTAGIFIPALAFAQTTPPDLGLAQVSSTLGMPDTDIRVIIANIIRAALGLLGIVAVVLVLYAGFLWMTAGGNEDKIAQSKKILTNAVIGLAIILSAYSIVSFVMNKLIDATVYPAHCSDERLSGDETDVDCGGSCELCSEVVDVCTNPPCGTFTRAFYIQSLPPAGNACVRNVRLSVIFTQAVDINTLNNNSDVRVRKSGGDVVSGTWVTGAAGNIAIFIPNGSCNPDSGSDCLEPNTNYILSFEKGATETVKSQSGASLRCTIVSGEGAGCGPVNFTTGSNVDRTAPTVIINSGVSFEKGTIAPVNISFTDDSGLQNMAMFVDGSNFVTSTVFKNCQKSGTVTLAWPTAKFDVGNHNLLISAVDWASNVGSANQQVQLRPSHCYNNIKDDNLDETGVDCGVSSGCGACENSQCVANTECASGFCFDGKCVDRLVIDSYNPLAAGPGSYVTIQGKNFGFQKGKVEFSASTTNPNIWKEATLANCGATSQPWSQNQIIAEVPAGAVNGPIRVTAASSDARPATFTIDYTNDVAPNGWGPVLPNFTVTNIAYPGLCPITPDTGFVGDKVRLIGKNLGTSFGSVYFGTRLAAVSSWTNVLVQSDVPLTDAGQYGVKVKTAGNGLESNSVFYRVKGLDDSRLFVSSIEPTSGPKDQYLTILGKNFGNVPGRVWFKVSGIGEALDGNFNFPAECSNTYWTNERIVVKVPSGGTIGLRLSVQVVRADGEVSGIGPFYTLTSGMPGPGICKIDPASSPLPFSSGRVMTIYGDNLVTAGNVCVKSGLSCSVYTDCPYSFSIDKIIKNGHRQADFKLTKYGDLNTAVAEVLLLKRGICCIYATDPATGALLKNSKGSSYFASCSDRVCNTAQECGAMPNACYTEVGMGDKVADTCVAPESSSAPTQKLDIFFWSANSELNSLNGRLAVTGAVVNNRFVTTTPPDSTKSGPVVVRRQTDNAISNPLEFTVGDCVKYPDSCTGGNRCCVVGPDTGVCRPANELCSGEVRSSGYIWKFSTRDILPPLRVVERCNEQTEIGKGIPSPTPSMLWKRPGYPNDDPLTVCNSALVTVEFSSPSLEKINSSLVKVEKCVSSTVNVVGQTCETVGAPVGVETVMSSDVGFYNLQVSGNNSRYLQLKPSSDNGRWQAGTWYRVGLSKNISVGFGPSSTSLVADRPCGENNAYCFLFKAGENDCRMRQLLVTPSSYLTSVLEAPIMHRSLGMSPTDLYYSGLGLSNQRCILMDVSDFGFEWSTGDRAYYADVYSGKNSQNEMRLSAEANTVGVGLTNEPVDAVKVSLTATSNQGRSYNASSPLVIDLSEPKIINFWPNCNEVCLDTGIAVEFSTNMSSRNLATALSLNKCLDENCLNTVLVPGVIARLYSADSRIVELVTGATLDPNSMYVVQVSNQYAEGTVKNPESKSDVLWSRANITDAASFAKPFNRRFEWRFKTKSASCKIERVEVKPDEYFSNRLKDQKMFTVTPYSSPDSCSAKGQILNAYLTDWNWVSSEQKVATVNNYKLSGYNKNCTSGCVRRGSNIPAGENGQVNYPVCGNGVVEAGEDCDIKINGEGPLSCTLTCLRPGNLMTTTTVGAVSSGKCGDGFVSPEFGEMCDPASSSTTIKTNCSANCLFKGSVANPDVTDKNAGVCGSGTVSAGEACDIGSASDYNNNKSAWGCNANCLHTGTRLAAGWCANNIATKGGYATTTYDYYCSTALSQCGDRIQDGAEDPGCDNPDTGWASSTCNSYCLLKNGDGADAVASVTGNVCNPTDVVQEGCHPATKQHVGSSMSYSIPSVCGDGVVGIGEDAYCEQSNAAGYFKNNNPRNAPWTMVVGLGGGTPVGIPPTQLTNIAASTNVNTPGNKVVTDSGIFAIKCGYTTDQECLDAWGVDENRGVANNTCCYSRPKITSVYPGTTSTLPSNILPNNVCPNTYIKVDFDRRLDYNSISGNVLIARKTSSTNCGLGLEDVTPLMNEKETIGVSDSKLKRIFAMVVGKLTRLLGVRPVIADTYKWCAGSDKAIVDMVDMGDDSAPFSRIIVKLLAPLATNSEYRIVIGENIKDTNGVKLGTDGLKVVKTDGTVWHRNYSLKFKTAVNVCTVGSVIVDPATYYFGKAGATTTLNAIAVAKNGYLVQPISGSYNWEYLWGPLNAVIVELTNTTSSFNIITAKNINGEQDVGAVLNVTENKYSSQIGYVAGARSHITVFLCANPWPPKRASDSDPTQIFPYEDKKGNNDGFNLDNNIFDTSAIPASNVKPSGTDGYYNFATYYCADQGTVSLADDLPLLRPAVQVASNIVSTSTVLKRFIMTNDKNSDAIGIQVFPNPDFLSVTDWYKKQFFSGATTVVNLGGYTAISDGNNFYVEALNYSESPSTPTQGVINSNIYLFSINQDASNETKKVFEHFLANLRFNTNLSNYGYCGSSMDKPDFSPATAKKCQTDLDCGSGLICSVQVDKLKRDYRRLKDWSKMEQVLNGYYLQNNNSYPDMAEGSYLAGQTVSTWPSWSALGSVLNVSLPTDPINKLSPAGTCASNTTKYCLTNADCSGIPGDTCLLHEPSTGWSTADRRFSFACNTSSLAYRYRFANESQTYQVHGKLEGIRLKITNWDSILESLFTTKSNANKFFPATDSQYATGLCTAGEEVQSMQTGKCGDGVINSGLGEECDPPGYRLYDNACTNNVRQYTLCTPNCTWKEAKDSTPCSDFSNCGNGVVEAGEVCDDGTALNGTYNHCAKDCKSKTSGLGSCGDGKYQSEYEFCDTRGGVTCGSVDQPAGDSATIGKCQLYSLNMLESCAADCSKRGAYCGDGNIDTGYGETCDGNEKCSIAGSDGERQCSGCRKADGVAAVRWSLDSKTASNQFGSSYLSNANLGCGQKGCPAATTIIAKILSGTALDFIENKSAVSTTPSTFYYLKAPTTAVTVTSTYTVSVWAYLRSAQAAPGWSRQTIVGDFSSTTLSSDNHKFWLKYFATSTGNEFVTLEYRDRKDSATDNRYFIDINVAECVGKWCHFAFSADETGAVKMYVNGALKNSMVVPGVKTKPLDTDSFYIGGNPKSDAVNRLFTGMIDEVAIYKRALTAAEVADIYNHPNHICVAKPTEVTTAEPGACGNKIIDANEACDDGTQNGVKCTPGYEKSCSYCSVDCNNVITMDRTGYCGDGIINPGSGEVCDTDPFNKYSTGQNIIYASTKERNKAPTTADVKDSVHNGYVLSLCSEEKNNQVNKLVISKNIADPFSTELNVSKTGTRSCVNNCKTIVDNCVSCGIDEKNGVKISGRIVNLLSLSNDPFYIQDLSDQNNPIIMNQTKVQLIYAEVSGGTVAEFEPNHNFRNNTYTLKNITVPNSPSTDALINSDPRCSATSTDNPKNHYRLAFNEDYKHLFDLEVVTDPVLWQYDVAVVPMLRKTEGQYKNVTLNAYPKFIRIVLTYVGDLQLYSGFSALSGKSFLFEGANIPAGTTTGTWTTHDKKYSSYKWPVDLVNDIDLQSHIWYHGFRSVEESTFQVEGYTVQVENLPNYAYAFYVRSPYQAISSYRDRKVRVDVYVPEDDDNSSNDWRKYSLPAKTFWLSDAAGSDNPSAQYWHVFNVKRLNQSVATINNSLGIENANRLVTGPAQIEF